MKPPAVVALLAGFGTYLPLSAAISGQFIKALQALALLALWIGAGWFIVSLASRQL